MMLYIIIEMNDDIFFIICLFLELVCLIFFVVYITIYFRNYKEKVDSYTKSTLIMLAVSITVQMGRLPLKIMELIHHSDQDASYRTWFDQHKPVISQIINVIIFVHGNFQKTAILINIARWRLVIGGLQK